ncbi:late control D family protein [Methylobacterium sp. 4-46]|uniref:phage late control D family protein n=1 Tax=unclassified Methylobacterium TaxID=2615210 RepID=UPI000152E8A5|nr:MULTISPECIES: late control D family protein [Methylobacterium]ACA18481.1 late control D family protein [Methylobacterium sp. 4-46]WFT77770.1 late control D family protein [Methylobacterium nodulans]
MVLATAWRVTVNGNDASDAMNPYITAIEVVDKAGGSSDSATLEFDDTDGQVRLPSKGNPVEIALQGVIVFKGVVDEAESSGARGGGMTLSVSCKSVDKRGKTKQKQHKHKDDATLKEFLEQAAKDAGLSGIKADKTLGAIKRPYWSTEGRSFLQLGQELAEEFGATFKIQGNQAVFAARGGGATPGGGTMPSVEATRPGNLISWKITPKETRPRYAKARVRWYDRKEGKWKQEDVEIGASPGAPEVFDLPTAPRATKDHATDAGKGRKAESEREGGSGEVTILLEVAAKAEGTCVVSGCRSGVDGTYRIESVTHKVSRSGAETTLSLKQPQGSAGSDERSSDGESDSSSSGNTGSGSP